MRRTLPLLTLLLLQWAVSSQGATIGWNMDNVSATPTPAATSVPPSSGTPVANLTVSDLTRGNGGSAQLVVSTVPSSGYTGASGVNSVQAAAALGALSVTTSAYFTFTLTLDLSTEVMVSGISFGERSTPTGPLALDIRSSLDNYTTSIGTATVLADSTWRLVTPTLLPTLSAANTPLTYRIYGSGGSAAASGNFKLDDITLTYSLLAVPEPSTWLMMIAGAGLLGATQRFIRRRR